MNTKRENIINTCEQNCKEKIIDYFSMKSAFLSFLIYF